MSGHSKWATIKHRKGAADQKRAKSFARLLRQVEVAAREGGGDLTANATLRTMYEKARDASVPKDTIDRAVKRGTGELEGVRYEPITYEGYAPCGVALMIECLSDNRNRTGAEIRAMLSKNGGSMAEPGAVAWQFDRRAVVIVGDGADEETLMAATLDAGAEDINEDGGVWEVSGPPAALSDLKTAVESAGLPVESAEWAMIPSTTVPLSAEGDARQVLRLIELLEDHDDVQAVHANFDIPDEVLEAVG
ncbi:MAG: YebC/PmpR family DNA-binding transcriptional regulator [Actinobacteria bacterium]|nr:YebC/PmpR family DNA-binding transcriptional regulator [Actinomycetota bacterium]